MEMVNQTTAPVPAGPQNNNEVLLTIRDDGEDEDEEDEPLNRKARTIQDTGQSSLAKEETEKIESSPQIKLKSLPIRGSSSLKIEEPDWERREEDGEQRTQYTPMRNDKGKSIISLETNENDQKSQEGNNVSRTSATPTFEDADSALTTDHEIQQEAEKQEPDGVAAEICISIKHRLKRRLEIRNVRGDRSSTSAIDTTDTDHNTTAPTLATATSTWSPCIFRIPNKLVGINHTACQPELISIGPYHKGKAHLKEWEKHKLYFLSRYLLRSPPESFSSLESVSTLLLAHVQKLGVLEDEARQSYSGIQKMSSRDFIEMMLVDGCFIVELLYHLNHADTVIDEDDPIFTRPELIPILIRDILKLENQIPYSILESLFDPALYPYKESQQSFQLLALEVFNLVYERPLEILKNFEHHQCKHLLDLFRSTLLRSEQDNAASSSNNFFFTTQNLLTQLYSQPSDRSIQCVTRLRPSGVKFKSKSKATSFLDINFHNNVLEIPSITVDEFASTLLINCVALEQTLENTSRKYFSDYVYFMGCLVNKPKDAELLCSDGIITKYSHDDKYVADLFNSLGQKIGSISRDSVLSKQARKIELYYTSPFAVYRRRYFSDPVSFISFYAIIIIILTLVQTVMAILSYIQPQG